MSSTTQLREMNGKIPRATRAPTSISSNITKVLVQDIYQIDKFVKTNVIISTKNIETNSQSLKTMDTRTKLRKTNTIKSRMNTMMSMMQNKITTNPMTI